ncbi:MAG TPA: ATPase [Flavobacteriales bacterium]|nr:ATPase [Flavobacteriales bacterium]
MSWQSFRENVNLAIYDGKETAILSLRVMSFGVSVAAVITLVYFYGFPIDDATKGNLLSIIKFSFFFYVTRYLVRLFYSFEPRRFIKEAWFEGLLMLLLLVDGVGDIFFGMTLEGAIFQRLGVQSSTHLSIVFIQIYILIITAFEIGKVSSFIRRLKLNPAVIFVLVFTTLILGGTLLLSLPEMTIMAGQMPFIDALFTSTSASCVTGLIVVDTPIYFSEKGLVVIMGLIKLGGLAIISFGVYFALISQFGVGITKHSIIDDFVHEDSVLSSKGLFGNIIAWSIAIELTGSILMYFSWDDGIAFASQGEKIFSSVFHSVSAFNNAGFTLFTDGIYNEAVRYNYMIHVWITLLVFFGALSFIAILDLFSFKSLKVRGKLSWVKLSFGTKVSLYFSSTLVILGAVAFYILESDNVLSGQSTTSSVVTSIFQSVSRTSGFSTVDFRNLSLPVLIMFLFLMFIGGSSSSTAGGIKISTFALLYASVISTITGKKQAELFNHSIANTLIGKALAVLMFFIVVNILAVALLSITEADILAQENRTMMDLIFEGVSAIGTVGLSMGITSELSNAGRIIILLSMFIGRVGALLIAFSFGKKTVSSGYKLPDGHAMMG